MFDNVEKIAKLRAEADKLELADKVFAELPEEFRLASTLHDLLCRWNHADGCGWFYEVKDGIDNWNGQSHEPYLRKARMVMTFCNTHSITPEVAINLLKLTKE